MILIPSNRPTSAEAEDNMPREERIFSISGNNKRLRCPFQPTLCQEGYYRNVKYILIGRCGEAVMHSLRMVEPPIQRMAEKLMKARAQAIGLPMKCLDSM